MRLPQTHRCNRDLSEFQLFATWKNKNLQGESQGAEIFFNDGAFYTTLLLNGQNIFRGAWAFDTRAGTISLDFDGKQNDDLVGFFNKLEEYSKASENISEVDMVNQKVTTRLYFDNSECTFENPYFYLGGLKFAPKVFEDYFAD